MKRGTHCSKVDQDNDQDNIDIQVGHLCEGH